MKQQINVKIRKSGSENGTVLRMIGHMNEGIKEFSARDLEGYFNCRNACYPNAINGNLIKGEEKGEVYHVWEKGEITLSLEWVELHELEPVELNEDSPELREEEESYIDTLSRIGVNRKEKTEND